MSKTIIQNIPIGFSEEFARILAECIAQGIVEKSVKSLQVKRSTDCSEDFARPFPLGEPAVLCRKAESGKMGHTLVLTTQ